MSSTYRIVDEASPAPYSRFAVQPLWPLLAFMLAHPLLGWLWFVVNGQLFGSATRKRELAIAGASAVGYVLVLIWLERADLLGATALAPYLRLLPLLAALCVSYWLFFLQTRSFQLYEYYGGMHSNGIAGLVVAYLLGPFFWRLLDTLIGGGTT